MPAWAATAATSSGPLTAGLLAAPRRPHCTLRDVLYHAQHDVICRALDVIDTITDRQTAFRIADALAARWAADTETVPPMQHLATRYPTRTPQP